MTLTALEGENFILMKEGHCLTGQALRFCQLKGFAPRVSFRSAQIETILSFVASGWGISIVPSMAHRPAHDGIAYRRVAGLRRSIGIITRAGRTLSREVREIIAFFRSRAKR